MRYGLDYIRELLLNPLKKIGKFREILAFFEPDPQIQGVAA